METIQPEAPASGREERPEVSRLLVAGLLLCPTILGLIGAMAKSDALAIASPLVGGGISGIVSGILLARRFGKTARSKILPGIVFSAVLAVVSFGSGFFGCMLGGFKTDFR